MTDRVLLAAKRHLDWRSSRRGAGPVCQVYPALLRAARIANGLTKAQAAQRFGVTRGTWNQWEAGNGAPGRERQQALLRWIDARLHPKSRTVRRRKT